MRDGDVVVVGWEWVGCGGDQGVPERYRCNIRKVLFDEIFQRGTVEHLLIMQVVR